MPPSLLLEPAESLRVMASTCICYAAFAAEGGPYLLPLGFALMQDGTVRLRLCSSGRALTALQADPRLCLAFSLIDGHAVDSVLAEGLAVLGAADSEGCTPVTVRITALSGRRFPITGKPR